MDDDAAEVEEGAVVEEVPAEEVEEVEEVEAEEAGDELPPGPTEDPSGRNGPVPRA